MDNNVLVTSREERLFMGSLQEKRQNGSLEEEDLAEMRDYFYFKRAVLKRCLNLPPRLSMFCPEEKARKDAFAKIIYDFHCIALNIEMDRLKTLEKYIVRQYFADGFYMTISKIQSVISSFDHSSFRRYKNRTGAGTYIEIEYRVKKEILNNGKDIRGIEVNIKNGDHKISVPKVGALLAITLANPEKKDAVSDMFTKSYPGLEEILDANLIDHTMFNIQPVIKNNTSTVVDGKSVSISCPVDIMNFLTDEIMLFLTSTFIGRNIAHEKICERIKELDAENKKQQVEPEL